MIQVFHHGGVDFHASGVVGLGLSVELVPGRPQGLEIVRVRCGDDAERFGPLHTRDPERIVPFVICTGVPVYEVGRGLQRPMGRRVGGVDEEWLPIPVMLVDVTDELVGVRAGGKETFLRGFDPFVVFHVHAFRYDHVAAGPRQQREGAVKAPVDRPLPGLGSQVPLAGHVGVITDLGQPLRQ